MRFHGRLGRVGHDLVALRRGDVVGPGDEAVLGGKLVQRGGEREIAVHGEDVVDNGDVHRAERLAEHLDQPVAVLVEVLVHHAALERAAHGGVQLVVGRELGEDVTTL